VAVKPALLRADDRDGLGLADPRQDFFSHVGKSRPGGGVSALNVPPKVWSTCGTVAMVFTASFPSFS
jgi:hypothetical protein